MLRRELIDAFGATATRVLCDAARRRRAEALDSPLAFPARNPRRGPGRLQPPPSSCQQPQDGPAGEPRCAGGGKVAGSGTRHDHPDTNASASEHSHPLELRRDAFGEQDREEDDWHKDGAPSACRKTSDVVLWSTAIFGDCVDDMAFTPNGEMLFVLSCSNHSGSDQRGTFYDTETGGHRGSNWMEKTRTISFSACGQFLLLTPKVEYGQYCVSDSVQLVPISAIRGENAHRLTEKTGLSRYFGRKNAASCGCLRPIVSSSGSSSIEDQWCAVGIIKIGHSWERTYSLYIKNFNDHDTFLNVREPDFEFADLGNSEVVHVEYDSLGMYLLAVTAANELFIFDHEVAIEETRKNREAGGDKTKKTTNSRKGGGKEATTTTVKALIFKQRCPNFSPGSVRCVPHFVPFLGMQWSGGQLTREGKTEALFTPPPVLMVSGSGMSMLEFHSSRPQQRQQGSNEDTVLQPQQDAYDGCLLTEKKTMGARTLMPFQHHARGDSERWPARLSRAEDEDDDDRLRVDQWYPQLFDLPIASGGFFAVVMTRRGAFHFKIHHVSQFAEQEEI